MPTKDSTPTGSTPLPLVTESTMFGAIAVEGKIEREYGEVPVVAALRKAHLVVFEPQRFTPEQGRDAARLLVAAAALTFAEVATANTALTYAAETFMQD